MGFFVQYRFIAVSAPFVFPTFEGLQLPSFADYKALSARNVFFPRSAPLNEADDLVKSWLHRLPTIAQKALSGRLSPNEFEKHLKSIRQLMGNALFVEAQRYESHHPARIKGMTEFLSRLDAWMSDCLNRMQPLQMLLASEDQIIQAFSDVQKQEALDTAKKECQVFYARLFVSGVIPDTYIANRKADLAVEENRAQERIRLLQRGVPFGLDDVLTNPAAKVIGRRIFLAEKGVSVSELMQQVDFKQTQTTLSERIGFVVWMSQNSVVEGKSTLWNFLQGRFHTSATIQKLGFGPGLGIGFYTGKLVFHLVNSLLGGYRPSSEAEREESHHVLGGLHLIRLMAHALNTLPSKPGRSYRGTTLTAENRNRYVPGAVVREAAFFSTSRDPRVASNYGDLRFKIEGQSGVEVFPFSKYPREEEVIFRPGTNFKVLAVKQGRLVLTVKLKEQAE
ncbi:MAG: ADP-ribosyltransferase domain-containing protein [Candidatus Margulisiibacteriota bacterium]